MCKYKSLYLLTLATIVLSLIWTGNLSGQGVCGDYGYWESDLNLDCYVNYQDLAQLDVSDINNIFMLATQWLSCSDPNDINCQDPFGRLPALPTNIDFGEVNIGGTSPVSVLPLTNVGGGELIITDIILGGAMPGEFSVSHSVLPITLQPGQVDQLLVDVNFTPGSSGLNHADLIIQSDDPASPVIISLNGTGNPASGIVIHRVNAGGPDYTDSLGQLWQSDSGFYNTGNDYTTTDAIGGTSDPTLYQSERWDNSPAPEMTYNFTVDPGQYKVRLHFADIYNGTAFVGGRVFDVLIEGQELLSDFDIFAETGFLSATTKELVTDVADTAVTIDFIHQVENPKISAIEIVTIVTTQGLVLNQDVADFGSLVQFNTSSPIAMTLTNNAVDPMTVSNFVFTGGLSQDVSIDIDPNFIIAPSEVVGFNLSFSPQSAGALTGVLEIVSNDPGDPLFVNLVGQSNPAGPGNLLVNPASIHFDDTLVGQSSAEVVVTVTNNDSANHELSMWNFQGTNPNDFSVTQSPALPITLNPGGSAQLAVLFNPSNPGLRTGELELNFDSNTYNVPVLLDALALNDPLSGGVIYRINAGGPDYIDPNNNFWQNDSGFFNTGETFGLTGTISGTNKPDLYLTERWDTPANSELLCSLPVAPDPGIYQVRLHFAEIYDGIQFIGGRIFDVLIENELALDEYDIFARHGFMTAAVEAFNVYSEDGSIDIEFIHNVENPKISAIELELLIADPGELAAMPAFLNWGHVEPGQIGAVMDISLTNSGDVPITISQVSSLINTGVGHDFTLTIDGIDFTGAHEDTSIVTNVTLDPNETLIVPVAFNPTEQADNDVTILFEGSNFLSQGVQLLGVGGAGTGHPFLHAVINSPDLVVDYDQDGLEDVMLMGDASHTHELGHALVAFEWSEPGSIFSTTVNTLQSFAIGDHDISLTIFDDNVPPEQLTASKIISIVGPNEIPGALLLYYPADGNGPLPLLDAVPAHADFAEITDKLKLTATGPATTDCNGNGIPDSEDILNATSPDCNGNGHPDECDLTNGSSVDVNANDIPDECEGSGSAIRGGKLYDRWWSAQGLTAPVSDHPLWQYRPDQASNLRSGSATWRCKECHGWDYKGVLGQYAAGSHRTGIPGILETTLTDSKLYTLLKDPPNNGGGPGVLNGHDFGSVMTDQDIHDLIAFINLGMIDGDTFIDPNSGTLDGIEVLGETYYKGAGNCLTCHGSDGTAINFGTPEDPEWVGTVATNNPWEFIHKVRFSQPGTSMPSWIANGHDTQGAADIGLYAQLNFPVDNNPGPTTDCNGNGILDDDDILNGTSLDCNTNGIPDECDLSSGASVDVNANSIPDECEINGSAIQGGKLYDNWAPTLGLAAPGSDHPLWQYRPDLSSNLRTGSATWRCKECHGWDYKGVLGQYAAGSHKTGIPGILGTTLSDADLFTLLKEPPSNGGGPGVLNGHDFGSVMTDSDIQDVIAFIKLGMIDGDAYIDPLTGVFDGYDVLGEVYYNGAGSCANCHGPDGTTINFGTPEDPEWVGTVATNNPWEFIHKVRFSQPGTSMPSWIANGNDNQGAADMGAYIQQDFPVSSGDIPTGDPDPTDANDVITIGASPYTGNIMVRMLAQVDITTEDTYEFQITGGAARRLFLNGVAVNSSLLLTPGRYEVEARVALLSLIDLSVEITVAQAGGPQNPIDMTRITHDETNLVPVINSALTEGINMGDNPIEITGLGFFPTDQVTVHWGGQDLFSPGITVSPDAINFLSPPGTGQITVTVETPTGISNSFLYTYSAGGPIPVNFNVTSLVPFVVAPTQGAWGPDGRLYVASVTGEINAYTFDDNYNVTATQTISTLTAVSNNNILGLAFNPHESNGPIRIYAAHSFLFADGGACIPPGEVSVYSGQVSVLTGPAFDTIDPLITGLSVSNHDHGINGLEFDNQGDLYICVGGNTNAGVIHCNLGDLPESPLSAAILKAHITRNGFNGQVEYVETVSGLINNNQLDGDIVDVIAGIDVDVFASGFRNTYDLHFTTWNTMYASDNGPNGGYGAASTGPTTQDPDPTEEDSLNLLVENGYYGHPNRNRGRTDARQNVFYGIFDPEIPGVFTQALATVPASSNGMLEYRAETFNGAMRDELLVQRWNFETFRFQMSPDKQTVDATLTLPTDLASLDILTGPGGVIFGIDYSDNKVIIATPVDLGAIGLTVYDIHPWRAPAAGGSEFIIGGQGFGSLIDTQVTIGGLATTLTSVSATRIKGIIPENLTPTGQLLDVVVTVNNVSKVLDSAFLYLVDPSGDTLSEAYIEVDPGRNGSPTQSQINESSTYVSGSFYIENNSAAGQSITRAEINISSAILPDVVYDPNGVAGDPVGKGFTVDTDDGVGVVGHQFLGLHDGGYDSLEMSFNNFTPGKTLTFSADMDPTNIKGAADPGPNHSGSISGLEIIAAMVTMEFSDGSLHQNELSFLTNRVTGSLATLSANLLSRPKISVVGLVTTPAVVSDPNQTIHVVGPGSASVQVTIMESALYLNGVPNGGFDLDPFESNTAIAVVEINTVIGAGGFVDIPVTLTISDPDGGYNSINAVLIDNNGVAGRNSSVLLLQLIP